MANSRDHELQLESYLDRPDEPEHHAMQAALENDPILAEKVRFQQQVLLAYELSDQEGHRRHLEAVYHQVKSRKTRRFQHILLWLCGLIAVVAAAILIFYMPTAPDTKVKTWLPETENVQSAEVNTPETRPATQPANPQQLAQAYFTPLGKLNWTMGGNHRSLRKDAQQAYDNGDYATAANLLKELYALTGGQDPHVAMGLGLCGLSGDLVPAAIRALAPLATNKTSPYRQQAQWYLALAYYRQGYLIQGTGLMEGIAKIPGHPKQADAKRFLKAL